MSNQPSSDTAGTLSKLSLILDHFTLEHPVRSLAELTRLSGIPKTSVFRVLKIAEACGLLSSSMHGYRPSLRLFELGMIAREGLSFGTTLNDTVRKLAAELDETIVAATLDRKKMLYLAVAEPNRPLRVAARAGSRREPLFGATGLMLLAALPPESWPKYLPAKLPRYTPRTVVSRSRFLRRLRQIREDGYVVERGEYTKDLAGIAVPVPWTDTSHRFAPLTLVAVAPENRLKAALEKRTIKTLQRTAQNFLAAARHINAGIAEIAGN
jgi:IclR family transcriptional regulator, KDG regulon repressor